VQKSVNSNRTPFGDETSGAKSGRRIFALLGSLMILGFSVALTGTPAEAAATPELTIFAGTPGTTGTPTNGDPANQTPLGGPGSLALGSDGSVYIGDVALGEIFKVSGGILTTLNNSICEPYGLAMTAAGDVLGASDCGSGLYSVAPDGTASVLPGTSVVDGATGVAVDPSGNIYVANGYGSPDDLYKITPTGTVSVFATSAQIGQPFSVATDSSGNVYVTDVTNNLVHKVTPGGSVTTFATPALNYPSGIVVNSLGDVFVSDTGGFKVYEITPSGSTTVVAGTGTQGGPTPGPPTSSMLSGPAGLVLNSAGDLLIADTDYNHQGVVEEVSNVSPPFIPTTGTPFIAGGGIVFPWTSVAGATSYNVTIYVNGVAQSTLTGLTGSSYTLSAPTPGDTYSFTISAVNGVGASAPSALSASVTAQSSSGYRLVGGDGGVFSYGASFNGSGTDLQLKQPAVSIAASPDGKGYLFVAKDGGVFSYGSAAFHGSVPGLGIHLSNIVGIASDPSTGGYWVLGADGGVYSFGAPFYGSVPELSKHVTNLVGIASTPNGGGYYLVASDGAVYAFGDARYQGGVSSIDGLNAAVVGIAVDQTTGGYWEASSGGGVYSYDAPFHGSAASMKLDKPIVGISATADGMGYYLAASDGGVFAYNAPFIGSMGGKHLKAAITGISTAG
jgi:NHL repeat